MNNTAPIFLAIAGIFLVTAVQSPADPPKKPSVARFTRLINESPFTIKQPPPARGQIESPLERDWMLGSIRPNKNGYAVTLINKKNRKERIRFIPGFSTDGFQLLDVQQDPNNSANSRVQVRKGSQTAWLTYDEKLIKIRPSAASMQKRPVTTNKGSKPAQNARPPIPGQSSSRGARTSRQRTVPKRSR